MVKKDFVVRCRVFAVGERVQYDGRGPIYTVERFDPPTEISPARVKLFNACGLHDVNMIEPVDPQPKKPMPMFERRNIEIEYNWFAPGTRVFLKTDGYRGIRIVAESYPPTYTNVAKIRFEDGKTGDAENYALAEPEITDAERVAAMKHEDYRGFRYGGCPKLAAVAYCGETAETYSTDYFKTDIEALDAFVRVLRERTGGK